MSRKRGEEWWGLKNRGGGEALKGGRKTKFDNIMYSFRKMIKSGTLLGKKRAVGKIKGALEKTEKYQGGQLEIGLLVTIENRRTLFALFEKGDTRPGSGNERTRHRRIK